MPPGKVALQQHTLSSNKGKMGVVEALSQGRGVRGPQAMEGMYTVLLRAVFCADTQCRLEELRTEACCAVLAAGPVRCPGLS